MWNKPDESSETTEREFIDRFEKYLLVMLHIADSRKVDRTLID